MKTKREEAILLGYKLLYDKTGKLITERLTTDITKLKKYLSQTDYSVLEVVVRDCTAKLDEVHNYIESNLDARKMTD
tara:strand:+ start:927 stop:1157 length:231 start_codon:yes stop_codon:yes gene_type:complete